MSCADSATDDPAQPRTAAVVPLVPAWRIDRAFDYLVPERLAGEVVVGTLVRVPFGGRRVRGVVTGVDAPAGESELSSIADVVFPAPVAPPPQDRVLEWIADRYVAPRGRTYRLAVPPRVRVTPSPEAPVGGGPAPDRVLAYSRGGELLAALSRRGFGFWCLQAVPGEDRGELISELVAAATAAGGSALVAVPEVRYGSEVIEALAGHWPGLARLDSAVPDGVRSKAWADLACGARLGAGGRAATLAPARDLRLIVIDEDHHPTYKEERSPRYDARRVALERARLAGARCVFVGSTPSIELGHAAGSGSAGWAFPSRERARAARPIVEVVEPADDRALTHLLHERVRDVLRSGGRVALLAPRRGYARALWCAACRRSLRCRWCEAGLRVGRSARRVTCPRCGRTDPPPDVCPSCGAREWRFMGAGSERLAEQIGATWPRARVARMDPDVLEERGPEPHNADADIYVTTWVGTKPALRPEVALVGVLDADALIRRPDFRAAERGFQALAEMSEWAGPASDGGRLIIQTAEPRHHAVQAVVRADYRFFLEREVELRKELGYPPFSELIKITVSGGDARAAIERMARVSRDEGARVLGPIAVRAQDVVSFQILCKCSDAGPVARALRPLVAALPATLRVAVDVDPR
jgi:primosomal protein N' (replication factor Y) (superfamily II helicase)